MTVMMISIFRACMLVYFAFSLVRADFATYLYCERRNGELRSVASLTTSSEIYEVGWFPIVLHVCILCF